jgi:class 3 adenylate cyclase/tetratricopeptide (TPR) repeat protein
MTEARKTVTIVFSDVSGSTALGERLDPETVRRVMRRYFDEAQAVLEHHGGTVEKFIGDAVMAVFGIPQLHEDDALRAVRAAAELRERLVRLNEELTGDWGVEIAVRTGVSTGEVVAGDAAQEQSFATGDAVNVAARLEQAARPGEILIGDATRRLVREAVRVEAVDALGLKGKAKPVPAWRLVEVLPDVPAFTRKLDAPFVGREHDLAVVEAAFERVASERACRLLTVLGAPGVGKSRLARELLTTVGRRARAVVGRCPPYGEGITYWPLAEIVEQVAGRDPAALAELVAADESAELVAERIAGAVGLAGAGGRSEEIFWAVRKLLEALARERPVIAVLDDIHWAKPTFLDLLEYLAGFASGPILLLALARTDLLEARASWASPRRNASTLVLEPLSGRAADDLIAGLAGSAAISSAARARIAEASGGNPLFVEQMLALQVEEGGLDGELELPPTIQALLAARIDHLPAEERAVLERASVEGRSFHRGAVSELLPEGSRDALGAHLMSLVRKEFIRPDRAVFPGDDGFRFAHILLREAAYGAMAKELRADLHERYAVWLAGAAEGRAAEYEEILGYHLEQAYGYRTELGPADDGVLVLGRQAAELLASAAQRVVSRGDRPAQVNLLSRAVELLPPEDRLRLELLAELGDALTEMGDYERAEVALREAIGAEAGEDAAWIAARARISLSELRYSTAPGDVAERRREVERAIEVLDSAHDELGLARAWDLFASLHHGLGRSSAAQAAWERSIEHARRAGSARDEVSGLSWLASVALWGPTPRVEARKRCEEILERVKGNLEEEANVLGLLGCLSALEGGFDEARSLQARRAAIFEELGLELPAAWVAHQTGWVELLADDAAAAELVLRPAYETLERTGANTQLQVVGSYLARALTLQGRYVEAERLALTIEELDPTGVAEIASARSARGKAVAALGRHEEGERLAVEAVALIDETDFLIDRADARMDLADILRSAGRSEEAAKVLEDALELHEQKGNVVSGDRAEALLEELGR